MKRVLIIACSQRKRPDSRPLPALDRYDGPAFQVLRKFLRECPKAPLDVFVLSAKFGLIPSHRRIPDYDFRLSKDAESRLAPQVARAARKHLAERQCESLAICAGREYRELLEPIVGDLQAGRIEVLRGGQGPRLTALKEWLWQLT